MNNIRIRECKLEDTPDFLKIMVESFQDKFEIAFKRVPSIKALKAMKSLFDSIIKLMDFPGLYVAKMNKSIAGAMQIKHNNMEGLLDDKAFKILSNILGFKKAIRASLILSIVESNLKENSLLIDSIAVAEKFRRVGVGKKILTHALNISNELNLRSMQLMVVSKNFGAQKFYSEFGFKKIGEKRSFLLKKLTKINSYYIMNYNIKA
ncbi:MAG: GNAT family N-acetyltransferase [Candidatus Lokiarchaeota archaeon]|nr:GNAT family N-acetyltransferase [Candidatus Lokiarchaeota archaeon]MBD3202425.1 GNAT family N-acetyltransferase [Candidatus Lokiarchaeota archaeon]